MLVLCLGLLGQRVKEIGVKQPPQVLVQLAETLPTNALLGAGVPGVLGAALVPWWVH